MKGFDPKFADFPDYILRVTKEIWEDRGIGERLRDYYAPDVIVRMPGGISRGEAATTAATLSTLYELPDRVLLGEDVIWSGTPEEGMLSSHRLRSRATHTKDGMFGPATGRTLEYLALADCYAKDNQISDEWLIRDNGAIVRQLGHDPQEWSKARVDAGQGGVPFTPENDVTGPYTGRGNDGTYGKTLAELLGALMDADLSVVTREWDRACAVNYSGGISGHGHSAADAFWLGLRASFPSATFAVHHQIGRDDPMMPPRAAVRWSLTGSHDGWGAFGAPTCAKVHVMGITHAEFGPWGLRREITLYDETAIWTQIALATG